MSARQPPSHSTAIRPRMSLHRYFIRLRDRLELILLRYVDGDPYARSDFAAYKADRNEKWSQEHNESANVKPATSNTTIATVKPGTTRNAAESPENPGRDNYEAHALPATMIMPESPGIKGKDKGTEVFPGFDFELAETAAGGRNAPSDKTTPTPAEDDGKNLNIGKDCVQRSRPREVSKASSTISSMVGSTISDARRLKRKKSDSRPGYFDPDPFPRVEDGGKRSTEVEADDDKLVMNIPLELRNRL